MNADGKQSEVSQYMEKMEAAVKRAEEVQQQLSERIDSVVGPEAVVPERTDPELETASVLTGRLRVIVQELNNITRRYRFLLERIEL